MVIDPITPDTFVRITDESIAGYVGDICRVLGLSHFGDSPEYNLRRRDGFEILNVHRDSFSVVSPAEQVALSLMWDPPKLSPRVSNFKFTAAIKWTSNFTPPMEAY